MNHELKWKDIAVKSFQGKTKQMIPKYEELYPYLKYNSLFLYNYGAELNVAKQYKRSIILLKECQKTFNDYDLQMLIADNYYQIGDTAEAIKTYQYAENMIPCRFLPLYYQFEIYKKNKNVSNAKETSQKIVKKEIKVKSTTVESIIEKADSYLNKNTGVRLKKGEATRKGNFLRNPPEGLLLRLQNQSKKTIMGKSTNFSEQQFE